MGWLGSCSICRIRKLFSSMNCSSSVRSSRKLGRKRSSFSRLLIRMRCTAIDLLGLATKTWVCQYCSWKTKIIRSYLEDVEALIVDHPPVVPQQLHDDLEVLARIHVLRHHAVVCSVEQDLAQQLDGLSLRHIAFRRDQHCVVFREEHVKVGL